MAVHGQSLNAVTTTGPGSEMMFESPRNNHSLFTKWTGTPDMVVVLLEATMNGVDWFEIATGGGVSGTSGEINATTPIVWPVIGTRANLTTLSGGTSPTVSAWIVSV